LSHMFYEWAARSFTVESSSKPAYPPREYQTFGLAFDSVQPGFCVSVCTMTQQRSLIASKRSWRDRPGRDTSRRGARYRSERGERGVAQKGQRREMSVRSNGDAVRKGEGMVVRLGAPTSAVRFIGWVLCRARWYDVLLWTMVWFSVVYYGTVFAHAVTFFLFSSCSLVARFMLWYGAG